MKRACAWLAPLPRQQQLISARHINLAGHRGAASAAETREAYSLPLNQAYHRGPPAPAATSARAPNKHVRHAPNAARGVSSYTSRKKVTSSVIYHHTLAWKKENLQT